VKFLKFLLFILLMGILGGCQQPEFTQQESAFIVWKSSRLKYADQGFIYEGKDRLCIEIYSNAQALMRLDITPTHICSSFLACMDKARFNKEMLSPYYPPTLLEHIFRAEAIMNGEGMVQKRNGFTQTIVKAGKYDISYSVLNKRVIFRDTINKIQIKVIKQ